MATDEYLLTWVEASRKPIMRFYGWDRPAVSFGYFQRYADISQWTPVRPLVRRPTGGGLVSHVSDWTYCLAIPAEHAWYQLKAADSYCRIHQWVSAALTRMGLQASLVDQAIPSGPGQCFIGAEKHDLQWEGQKVAGAAQRRTRDGLLIQGSVQIPHKTVEASRPEWQTCMIETGIEAYQIRWTSIDQETCFSNRCLQTASDKYRDESFLKRK